MSAEFKHPTIWTGNTYPVRDAIRSLGGVWDAELKAWRVPALTMQERARVHYDCKGLHGITIRRAEEA